MSAVHSDDEQWSRDLFKELEEMTAPVQIEDGAGPQELLREAEEEMMTAIRSVWLPDTADEPSIASDDGMGSEEAHLKEAQEEMMRDVQGALLMDITEEKPSRFSNKRNNISFLKKKKKKEMAQKKGPLKQQEPLDDSGYDCNCGSSSRYLPDVGTHDMPEENHTREDNAHTCNGGTEDMEAGDRTSDAVKSKYDTKEHIEAFLRDGLGMTCEMKKSELQLFFLDKAGIILNDSSLDELFTLVDVDKSGLVSVGELASFVHGIQPSCRAERSKYVLKTTVTFAPFYLCLLNLAASLLAASTNLRERPGGDLADVQNQNYWGVAAICDLIGNFGYVILKYEEESLAYEAIHQARVRLIKWVTTDLPRFVNAREEEQQQRDQIPKQKSSGAVKKLSSSFSRFNFGSIDEDGDGDKEYKIEIDCGDGEKEQETVVLTPIMAESFQDDANTLAVDIPATTQQLQGDDTRTSDGSRTGTGHGSTLAGIRSTIFNKTDEFREGKADDDDDGLDLHEMRLLLESMGVFLPELALREVFWEVDVDHSGTVSIKELQDYALELEKGERTDSTTRRCGYLRQKHISVLDRCVQAVGFWTGWCFVIGACFWVTFSHCEDCSDEYFRQFVGATCFFYLCGAIGNLCNVYDATNVTFWQLENADMMLRAAAIATGKAIEDNKDIAYLMQSTVMSSRDHRTFLRSIKQSARSNKRTSSNFSEDGEEETRTAQEEGARCLFRLMDISRDSNVDETELFDTLVALGILIPVHTFQKLFSRIDKSGDGNVDVDELVQYIASIEPSKDTKTELLATTVLMMKQFAFYLVLVQCTAGFLQTIAAYSRIIPGTRTKNMFLVGSCCWAVGSIYFLVRWPSTFGSFFDQMEQYKFMLKKEIIDECQEFWQQKKGATSAEQHAPNRSK